MINMPIGILCNCGAVLIGGLTGALLGKRLDEGLKKTLNMMFGLCAAGNGIASVVKVYNMPPVILAIITGAMIGYLFKMEVRITSGFSLFLSRILKEKTPGDMRHYITAVVIFCASGFGFYGAIMESMAGDSSWLLSKSIMDLFTAFIFAGTLGIAVSMICLPQFLIMLAVFFAARWFGQFVENNQLMNFMACGGILTIAAGFRVSGIMTAPVADMIPALILVMPFTSMWDFLF
jgi:uncharacterized membrane protein YqgA involved in biofilm formation